MTIPQSSPIQRIHPSTDHLGYWHYAGEPLLLVGGSREDNLFQIEGLETHLDTLAAAGGNCIRNVMSDRDPGNLRAFAQIEDGPNQDKYDLDQWNPAYWEAFERLLQLCVERQIIVQIEVWDRFDHSQDFWLTDPFNPKHNINYTSAASGLAQEYPKHPMRGEQPFFHTIPAMDDNALLRGYQERFVSKMLSISLGYPNVLYCMNNETHEDPAWGQYWIQFIRRQAADAGVDVWASDMFDGTWDQSVPPATVTQFNDPRTYPFIDVSQINAWRCSRQQHLKNLEQLNGLNHNPIRPLNNTKVYVADTLDKPDRVRGSDREGVTSFWMNLLGGCASARFHRPPSGLALSETAQASIRAVRKVERLVRFWDLTPRFDWDGDRPPAEAVLAQQDEQVSLVLLPDGGAFKPMPPMPEGEASIHWLDLFTGDWAESTRADLNPNTPITAPNQNPWLAVIRR